ncbi:MAG: hypothetical protein K6T83_07320 [Alicyclobacillus sp.]|nr:hypothetical protein [Alicyclobacillus sp.]
MVHGGVLMRRAVETSFIIVLSVLTVSATATVIRDAQSNRPDPVAKWLRQEWTEVSRWAKGRFGQGAVMASAPANAEDGAGGEPGAGGANRISAGGAAGTRRPSEGLADSSLLPVAALPQSPGPFAAASPGSPAEADLARLSALVQTLLSSLTPADWQAVTRALTSDSPAEAQRTLMRLWNDKLSPSDASWFESRFGGTGWLDETDVKLLQQSVAQAQAELTPAERGLLRDEWLAWLQGTQPRG